MRRNLGLAALVAAAASIATSPALAIPDDPETSKPKRPGAKSQYFMRPRPQRKDKSTSLSDILRRARSRP